MYSKDISMNSSASSSQLDFNESKTFVKDLLRSRIFLGRYLERRLIDERIGYRDIVLISAAEVELKKDLQETLKKIRTAFPSIRWIGITDTEVEPLHNLHLPSGLLIWTEIDNQPFGVFWFQVKSVKFRQDEVIVTLKCIRHITEAYLEVEPILYGAVNKLRDDSSTCANEKAPLNETYSNIMENLHNSLSISNVKEFMTFLCALVIAIFTGSTSFINFIGNFVLALIREISILIKNSTPMFLGVLDFFSKIVGGFYILIAMFFRPNNPMPLSRRAVTNYKSHYQHPDTFDPRYID